MEDVISHVAGFVNRDWDFLVCLDGHSGSGTASFVAHRLPEVLASHLTPASTLDEIKCALDVSFEQVDKEVVAKNTTGGLLQDSSGACCVCSVITPTHFIVASCGDCVALRLSLVSGGTRTTQVLTRDHAPSDPTERARIVSAGDCVVGLGDAARVNGDLNVSRAFGDAMYKTPARRKLIHGPSGPEEIVVEGLTHKTFPITAHPDIVSVERSVNDVMLLLGSDGLVDLDRGAAIDKTHVANQLWDAMQVHGHVDPMHLAVLACDAAFQHGSADNISAILWRSPLVPAWKHSKDQSTDWSSYMSKRRFMSDMPSEVDPFPACHSEDA